MRAGARDYLYTCGEFVRRGTEGMREGWGSGGQRGERIGEGLDEGAHECDIACEWRRG